jgi:lysophospholipase L1-like esterase
MRIPLRPHVILVSVAIVAGVLFALRPDGPRAARPTSGLGIVAFGDSLVEGRGATLGEDFVSVLSRRLGVSIVNAGHSGDTTEAALARLERDVLGLNPRIAIVLLGGNDYLRRIPTTETFANLEGIVTQIRQQGAAVVVVGVGVGLMTDPYRQEYEALARRTSAGLVPDILDGIIGHPDLMSDSIHPNSRGYAMVADRLEPMLRDLMRSE